MVSLRQKSKKEKFKKKRVIVDNIKHEEDFEITDAFQGYFPDIDSIKNDVSNT